MVASMGVTFRIWDRQAVDQQLNESINYK